MEETVIVVDAVGSIDPRVADNDGSLGELELGNLRLDLGVFNGNLFNGDNLVAIGVCVEVGSQAHIALNRAR